MVVFLATIAIKGRALVRFGQLDDLAVVTAQDYWFTCRVKVLLYLERR